MGKSFDIAELSASDGFTPVQSSKLNANFRRLASMVADEVPAQQQGMDYRAISHRVEQMLEETFFNLIMPVGTMVAVKSPSDAPKLGVWEVCSDIAGRYVRAGSSYSTGGRASFRLTAANIPDHRHAYERRYPTASTGQGTGGTAPSAWAMESALTATPASGGLPAVPEAVALDPSYVDLVFMRRVA